MESENYFWLAGPEQNDRLIAETADKEMKEKEEAEVEAEAERKAKAAKDIRNLAARLDKARKELLRKKEDERVRKEAEALELQRLKEEEERKLKLKQEEKRHGMLKAKQKEKALRPAQERAKEEKERMENEEREDQERSTKLAEETRLRLEEAATKAKAEETSIFERSHSPCEAQARLSLLVKQDGQLEDGRDVDTETSSSNSTEDGKDKSKDDLRIVEKFTTIHCDENHATASRDSAISLLQEQEDGLTSVQKIAMIFCFMEDVVAAKTYILLTDPEVRQGWILKMLKKCPM